MAQLLQPWVGDFIQKPSPNHGYPGERPIWRAVTWHITEGDLAGALSWLTSPDSDASAHVIISRDGKFYQLVDFDAPAWAQGRACNPDLHNPIVRQTVSSGRNPNLVSYSIECVGYSAQGRAGALTDVQAQALKRLTAYLCWRSRLTVDRDHVLGHYQWDSCTRAGCPGYAVAEWDSWIAGARALAALWRGW